MWTPAPTALSACSAVVAELACSGIMAFPSRLLNPGEEVILDVRPHWWYLAGPVVISVLVLAGAATAGILRAAAALDWIVVAVLAVSLLWLVARYLRWSTTRLLVTTTRLIHRRGLVSRTGREIPLEQLSDVSYRQSVIQRVLGAGDLRLESAGRDSAEVFSWLPHPGLLQNEIYRQIEADRSRFGAGPGLSLAEQLEKLDELRRRGVLTPDEFDAQKARLLGWP